MPELNEVLRQKARVEMELLSHPDVTGVGVGYRVTGGKQTHDPVIRVYVRKKRPLAEVPENLRIPAEIHGIATDVIDKGPDVHTDGCIGITERPVQGGLEITRVGGGSSWLWNFSGTGCCFVKKVSSNGPVAPDVFLLTAAHVLDPPNYTMVDDVVYQAEPVLWWHRIGLREQCVYGGTVDAGIATIDDGIGYVNSIYNIGNIAGTATANLGDPVRKNGRTTAETSGTIADVSYTGTFAAGVTLTDLIVIDPIPATGTFCDYGDSGSPVVNNAMNVLGVLIAMGQYGNGGTGGIACKIGNVFSALSIELADLPSAQPASTAGSVSALA